MPVQALFEHGWDYSFTGKISHFGVMTAGRMA